MQIGAAGGAARVPSRQIGELPRQADGKNTRSDVAVNFAEAGTVLDRALKVGTARGRRVAGWGGGGGAA